MKKNILTLVFQTIFIVQSSLHAHTQPFIERLLENDRIDYFNIIFLVVTNACIAMEMNYKHSRRQTYYARCL